VWVDTQLLESAQFSEGRDLIPSGKGSFQTLDGNLERRYISKGNEETGGIKFARRFRVVNACKFRHIVSRRNDAL
jgi:hypothetical protein